MTTPITLSITVRLQAIAIPEPTGGYSIAVPALPGCYSQADTIEQAQANVVDAAEGWLAAGHDHNKDEVIREMTTELRAQQAAASLDAGKGVPLGDALAELRRGTGRGAATIRSRRIVRRFALPSLGSRAIMPSVAEAGRDYPLPVKGIPAGWG